MLGEPTLLVDPGRMAMSEARAFKGGSATLTEKFGAKLWLGRTDPIQMTEPAPMLQVSC